MAGHSNVAGYELIGKPDGTRLAVYNALIAAGLPFNFTGSLNPPASTVPDNDCSAVAGHRIWQQRAQVEADLAAYPVDVVCWLCGANDFGIEGIVAADLVADIEDMILDAAVLYPSLRWVLCTETFQTTANADPVRLSFNTQLRTMVATRAAQGYRVIISETAAIVDDVSDLFDNVHFTDAKYIEVGNAQAASILVVNATFPGDA